jgi:hypothetical protein
MVGVYASTPKVKGSNLMGGVVYGEQWYVDRIFSIKFLEYVPRLIMWPTNLPRLGF